MDRFVAAIESGELPPGEKLPPTRRLAEEVGVNHLTAARVYRKLAELGYVSASVGRGTFVRSLAPAGSTELGDDWQVYALPDREIAYPEQVLADAFSVDEPGMLSLATGWPAPRTYPVERARAGSRPTCSREEGVNALSYLPAEGLYALREQIAKRGRRFGFATEPDEIVVTSGAQQGLRLAAEATLEPGDVAVIESPSFIGMIGALRATGARVIGVPVDEHGLDVDGARAAARPPRGEARGAPDRVPQPHRVRPRAGARRAGSPSWRWSATSSCSRTRCTPTPGSRASARARSRELAPGARDPRRTRCRRSSAPACAWAGWPPAGRSASASRWRSCWPTSRPPRSPSTSPRAGSPQARTTATSRRPCPSTASAATR